METEISQNLLFPRWIDGGPVNVKIDQLNVNYVYHRTIWGYRLGFGSRFTLGSSQADINLVQRL